MTETGVGKHDPLEATLLRLAARGRPDIPIEIVIGAWRDALYPELESRLGARMTVGLTDAQMKAFLALVDGGNDNGASEWLGVHVPNYPAIVGEELNRLVDEAVEWLLRVSVPAAEVAP